MYEFYQRYFVPFGKEGGKERGRAVWGSQENVLLGSREILELVQTER